MARVSQSRWIYISRSGAFWHRS